MTETFFETINASFPCLSFMIILPLLAVLLLLLAIKLSPSGVDVVSLRNRVNLLALVCSLVIFFYVIVVAVFCFDWSIAGSYQLLESYTWIPKLGISWSLAVSVLGLSMIMLTSLLVPLVLLSNQSRIRGTVYSSRHQSQENGAEDETSSAKASGQFAIHLFLLEAFIFVIFSAFDLVLFYLAFEAMLIPLFFLIGKYGSSLVKLSVRSFAATKTLIYSLAGGLVMLVGVIAIYATSYSEETNTLFRYDSLASLLPQYGTKLQLLVFITFFIAFAIKAPMVPLHTWLADAAESATPGTSAILVGILDKIGTYGMIVFCLQMLPNALGHSRTYILILAVISILWAAFVANSQDNLLRLISFTSVSHFGFMVLGIFIGQSIALTGAMFYMVAHGISIAAMFITSDYLILRGRTASIREYGGMQRVTPILAGFWLVAGLASIALPGLSGFVPEFLVFLGTFDVSPIYTLFSIFAVVAAALYILMPYQRIFTGTKKNTYIKTKTNDNALDLNWRERVSVFPLLILALVLGMFSSPLVSSFDQIAQKDAVVSYSNSAESQVAETLDLLDTLE